ncbi:DUF3347 domain-containing protein [Chryseobacterium sp. L7]|uniref:DUF3347 domain-containing protein n=1 Tax=Chryseobacterium endalhagicum TaxID=2797638 RepID=A0ABS1QF01_9FLAO|nr:DUF3347 domain-containing protein [Chryseobacterium endalhagicum]MBL1221175.1 DUF3347 domain-containing protein [Chryseobacterium endalhagicum]
MKLISKILVAFTLLISLTNNAQIKNTKTETIKVYGSCDLCKGMIEKAGTLKKTAAVTWNKDTQTATLTYDAHKTNQEEILKRIALAGFDNEKFLAPDDIYAALPECCHYSRELKPTSKSKDAAMNMAADHSGHDHSKMTQAETAPAQNSSQLKPVFDSYFSVKNALVNTDSGTASAKAGELLKAIKAVDMTKLSTEEHMVWMKIMKDLTANAEKTASAKDVAKQREIFALLSRNIYDLAKVSQQGNSIYYQHCPMYNNGKGANWLSLENEIRNPYFGSQMITCGSTVETIDNK